MTTAVVLSQNQFDNLLSFFGCCYHAPLDELDRQGTLADASPSDDDNLFATQKSLLSFWLHKERKARTPTLNSRMKLILLLWIDSNARQEGS